VEHLVIEVGTFIFLRKLSPPKNHTIVKIKLAYTGATKIATNGLCSVGTTIGHGFNNFFPNATRVVLTCNHNVEQIVKGLFL
jgi:acyl-CoA hydrolase